MQKKTEKNLRSPIFSALCILAFIVSAVNFIVYFLASLFFEKTSELVIEYSSWHTVEKISPFYFNILMVLFALSLVGAIRIWKFHRDGFVLFTLAQVCILFLPVVWIDWNSFSVINAIFACMLIAGFGLNWKLLK